MRDHVLGAPDIGLVIHCWLVAGVVGGTASHQDGEDQPRLLMLDEPSLGLAPVVVSQVFDTIRRLHAEGLTILLVEQNLKKALEMADRGYVVETGSISTEGAAADLLADPTIRSAYLGV
jgi:branched-chain amino acid transport system ATP-binding protein